MTLLVMILHSTLGSFQNDLSDIKPNKEGFYEIGDILLDEEQFNETFYPSDEMLRGTINEKLWPNGVIPYKFSSYFTKDHKDRILSGIAYINENLKGCIEIR